MEPDTSVKAMDRDASVKVMERDTSVKVFVSAILHDGKGRVLMARRGGAARDRHGQWEFGGGSLEAGETLEAALVRETREELGVELTDMRQLYAHDFVRDSGTWIGIFYVCRVDPADVSIVEPVYDELGWFVPEALPEPTFEIAHELVALAKPYL